MVLKAAPRFVVLGGAGAIGRIVVRDLYESSRKNEILVADHDERAASNVAKSHRSPRVSHAFADAREASCLASLLSGSSVVINCTHHEFNLAVMEAALRARVHYLDLGGLFTWTRRQFRLKRRFVESGLTAVLGMGCAPGITNVMAAYAASQLDRVRSIKDAASLAGISYRTAWSAIQQMEQALGRPMVVSRAGGPGGGATTLTDECRQLLALYQSLRRRLEDTLGRVWQSAEPAAQAGD